MVLNKDDRTLVGVDCAKGIKFYNLLYEIILNLAHVLFVPNPTDR